jgi:hypothetical protein
MLVELALGLMLQEPSGCPVRGDSPTPRRSGDAALLSPERTEGLGLEPVCQPVAAALLEPALTAGSAALSDRIGPPDQILPASNGTVHRWYVAEPLFARHEMLGGSAGSVTGSHTSTYSTLHCVLAVAWDHNDRPLGWRIEGNAGACNQILRWLR